MCEAIKSAFVLHSRASFQFSENHKKILNKLIRLEREQQKPNSIEERFNSTTI